MMKYYSGLKQKFFLSFSFGRSPKSRCQQHHAFPEGCRGRNPFLLLLVSGDWVQSLAFFDLQIHYSDLCLLPQMAFSLHVSMCLFFWGYKWYWIMVHANPVWVYLNYILIISAKTSFPNKLYLWVLEAKTSTYLFWGLNSIHNSMEQIKTGW